jgi:hypothetical protein
MEKTLGWRPFDHRLFLSRLQENERGPEWFDDGAIGGGDIAARTV